MVFAVFMTGGKQYTAEKGKRLKVENLPIQAKKGDFIFDKVLLARDDKENIVIGKPFIEGAHVTAEIVGDGKAKKVLIFRYHSKTRYRKKKGHRQPYTEVIIKDIKTK